MKHRCFKRLVSLTVAVTLVTSSFTVSADDNSTTADESSSEVTTTSTSDTTTTSSADGYENERLTKNYTNISSTYTYDEYNGDTVEYAINEAYDASSGGVLTSDNYDYKNDVVQLEIGENASFVIDVPQDGIYNIKFDYLSYSDSILPVEMTMKVNGETPFYETAGMTFESMWVQPEEKSYDRYGNEIVSIPDKVIEWQSKYVSDASYRYAGSLKVQLSAGENNINLEVTEGSILLGNIYLEADKEVAVYEKNVAEGDNLITIEAEDVTYRNDSSIRPVCEYDTALTPYDTKQKVLNVIDSTSFADAGQSISYEVEVEEDGYYYFQFAYKQSDKVDFPVFCDVAVDGVIPNDQLVSYPFDYEKSYTNMSLEDTDGDKIGIYLPKGTHTISLTISNENIRSALETIDNVMNEINDLALEITKVAGTNKDKYRDFNIEAYIPDAESRLLTWAEQLENMYDELSVYSPGVKSIGALSSVNIAVSSLESLAEDVNELPYRLDELSQSTNSVNQYLANVTENLNANDLAIDKIYIYQKDASIPKNVGFFEGMFLSAKRFVASFTSQDYSTTNVDESHLQVWVNRPRQYVEILQTMIDEYFTPETGIEVDLSIMPDQNKLVLANASGDSPDVAMAINYALPFDLAIRGAIKDLTEYDDYQEIMQRFPEGLLVPSTIDNGIYSVPETFNFYVLYYRTDILEKLGLEIPNTMDDVIAMLPELQTRGLNFFYPTAGTTGTKTLAMTTPLLYQYNGSVYGDTATEITLNSEETISAFETLTDLFAIYNVDKDVPSFYQHFRNGDIPIGIADYSMYNLLINAAPEIANSWDISVVPGVEDENGEVQRYTAGGAENCVIFNSTDEREDDSWEFLKWWTSAETQAEFGQTLQITYGSEYIWNSSNTEAFEELPWASEDKAVIVEQTEWIYETPRILATYMVERELSTAYNSVVLEGDDVRTSLDSAIKRIRRETIRKLEEFGYIKNGEVVKEYVVPTLEKVKEIIGTSDE